MQSSPDTLNPNLTSSENGQQGSTTASTTTNLTNLTPEQITQREKIIKSLESTITALHSQTTDLETQIAEATAKLSQNQPPSAIVKQHIRLLHDYNEIKDIGQGLMGLIAEARGVRVVEVQREFGVVDRD